MKRPAVVRLFPVTTKLLHAPVSRVAFFNFDLTVEE